MLLRVVVRTNYAGFLLGSFLALTACGGESGESGGASGTTNTAGTATNGASGSSDTMVGNGGSANGISPDSGIGAVDAKPDSRAAMGASDGSVIAYGDAAGTIDLNGYNPCPPAGTPCAVMPLGDSITLGLGAWTGYRGPMFSLVLKDAKKMVYVGSLLDGPDTVDGVPFPRAHEGHSGFTIDGGGQREGIKALMVNAMTQFKPNIITMMIGTNDVQTQVTDIPTHYAGLVDLILSADPKVLLVAAQVIPTGTDSNNVLVQAMNASICDIVRQRAAVGKHITLVDMYTPFVATPNFKTQLLVDDLHPKFDGYVIMANTYYSALGPLLR